MLFSFYLGTEGLHLQQGIGDRPDHQLVDNVDHHHQGEGHKGHPLLEIGQEGHLHQGIDREGLPFVETSQGQTQETGYGGQGRLEIDFGVTHHLMIGGDCPHREVGTGETDGSLTEDHRLHREIDETGTFDV